MTDLITSQILANLGILSLEQHPDGHLSIIGESPAWAIQLLSCVRNRFARILPEDISPFLENFMADAEEFWQTRPCELLRSGLWTETYKDQTDKDQTDINLEAVAMLVGHRKVVLIEASTAAYQEKLSWLQIARQEQLQILSERKILATRMMSATFYDSLTGLPNYTFFSARLSQLTAQLNQSQHPPFIILNLNLDSFQGINDSLGRELGDQLLIELAQRLQAGVQSEDIVARLGSDEFGILLVNLHSQVDIDRRVKQVRSRLGLPYQLGSQLIYTTVSIGMVVADQPGQTARDLFRDVCTAMHHAKGLGRGHLVKYDPAMHIHAMQLLNLENDLHFAVKKQELDHDYFPLISLKTQKILGVEIVVHWNHPTLGKLQANEFMPLAQESQQTIAIDEFSLLTAGRLLNDWSQSIGAQSNRPKSNRSKSNRSAKKPSVQLMLLLNSLTWLSDTFTNRLNTVLQAYNCAPDQLILEVTEETVLAHRQQMKILFQDLRHQGFQICLTELGSKFTSWSYLEDLSLDYLKLDGTLSRQLNAKQPKQSSADLVQEISELAHALKFTVIADQVETLDQSDIFAELGCDFAQGPVYASACQGHEWGDLLGQRWIDFARK